MIFDYLRRLWDSIFNPSSESVQSNGIENNYSLYPVYLPENLMRKTQELLRSFSNGEEECEGLVYWAGFKDGNGGVVTTLIVPDAKATPGSVETTAVENAKIVKLLNTNGLVLLGQAHSHPPGSGNHHSQGDDMLTFSPFEGHISIVAANYARPQEKILETWGVHRFYNGRFKKIDHALSKKHLRIIPPVVNRRMKQN
ncbi:hypothetical protein NC796_02215 [Aliifodinibius sp. S!AR15-10]|uniref:hypothetical protein n=1 Tax=Aliifodinibius sp. S!AR15-10 TaxID=2950437 RepID=UPI002855799B|nr:hypothetical protein [Aliifodinibius sp. S!AR15-10]MDR8389935.1 hypothetical protein [Aliifodinibius sp. S!AR15-10]